MTSLYIPMGPPGCGKSTLQKHLVKTGILPLHAVVSTDMFRWAMTGSRVNQDANSSVFHVCKVVAEERLQRRLPVYIDATGRNTDFNDHLVACAHRNNVAVFTILWDLPEDVIRAQNAQRDNPVPEDVMDKFLAYFSRNPKTYGTVLYAHDLMRTHD